VLKRRGNGQRRGHVSSAFYAGVQTSAAIDRIANKTISVVVFNSGRVDRYAFVLFVYRKLEGNESFYVVINLGTEQEIITLYNDFKDVPYYMLVRSSSINAWQTEK